MVAIPRLTVRTEYGSVLAVPHRGSLLFRNVPFAAPPFGKLRFLPPQRPEVWDGLRDGAEPGVGMPQPMLDDALSRYAAPAVQGEDALTLEVLTPELGRVGMPVMVWIHPGGFITGAGSAQVNDGYAFARAGIVHVAINSRLSIDGYTLWEDSEANHADNLALRDQIAALEWVQRNIGAFGGDPANVTIAGQSTGASSVGYLLASPAAKGLFVRAISQSGSSANWMTITEASQIAHRIAAMTGRAPMSDAMRDLSFDETRAVVARTMAETYGRPEWWKMIGRIPLPFAGVVGTEMLPEAVVPAIAHGAAAGIPILAGTTRDETSGFFAERFPELSLDSAAGRQMVLAFGVSDETVAQYRVALGVKATDLAVASAIATEVWAKRPTLELLRAHGGENYLYDFVWESPYFGEEIGAAQGLDLPFSRDDFETLQDVPRGKSILGKAPSAELAKRMNAAFVEFVKTGNPGWAQWSPAESEIMLFSNSCAVADSHLVAESAAAGR